MPTWENLKWLQQQYLMLNVQGEHYLLYKEALKWCWSRVERFVYEGVVQRMLMHTSHGAFYTQICYLSGSLLLVTWKGHKYPSGVWYCITTLSVSKYILRSTAQGRRRGVPWPVAFRASTVLSSRGRVFGVRSFLCSPPVCCWSYLDGK